MRIVGFPICAVLALFLAANAGAEGAAPGGTAGDVGASLIPRLDVGLMRATSRWANDLKLGVNGPPDSIGTDRTTLVAWTPFVSGPRVVQRTWNPAGKPVDLPTAGYRLDHPRVLEPSTSPRVAEPYVWLGWNAPVDRDDSWAFSIDIGVLLRRTSFDVLTAETPIVDDPMLIPQIVPEDEAAEEAARGWRFQPVMSVGANIRF